MMRTSEKGKRLIRDFEGLRLETYHCPAGKLTIGYGHTSGVRAAMKITKEQAEAFLNADLLSVEHAINSRVKVSLTQGQFDALASFVFNLGEGAFQHSTLLAYINQGKMALVPGQLLRWVHCNGVVLKGLQMRRKAEVALWTAK